MNKYFSKVFMIISQHNKFRNLSGFPSWLLGEMRLLHLKDIVSISLILLSRADF